jgi:hypothetical protein
MRKLVTLDNLSFVLPLLVEAYFEFQQVGKLISHIMHILYHYTPSELF